MRDSLNKSDVARLFTSARVIRTPYFIFKVLASTRSTSRITFAFSRKCGGAVQRNLFKRRLRHLVRSLTAVSGALDALCLPRQALKLLSATIWVEEKKRIVKAFAGAFRQAPRIIESSHGI